MDEENVGLVERARGLLERDPVMDGHNDLPWALRRHAGYDLDKLDVSRSQPTLHTDIPRLRSGGVGAQFWSVFVPSTLAGDHAVSATLEQIDAVYALVRRYPETFALATDSDGVTAALATGRIASLMGAEGGHSIDCSLATLRMLHRLGVRYLTLTHNDNVPWADSATDEPKAGGLTRFGAEVVREMNRLGMLVDCSHVAPDTMRAALRVTEAPLIFSHSSAWAVCNVPRNVPDDVLGALAGNGGVCMVTFVPGFVSPECATWESQVRAEVTRRGEDSRDFATLLRVGGEWAVTHPRPVATVGQVADHVDHVRQVAGIDHVGIGGDYDGVDAQPQGMEDVSGYPRLIAELLDRGWSDADIGRLTCRNVLRVLRDAESVARDLQARCAPSLATIADLDQG